MATRTGIAWSLGIHIDFSAYPQPQFESLPIVARDEPAGPVLAPLAQVRSIWANAEPSQVRARTYCKAGRKVDCRL